MTLTADPAAMGAHGVREGASLAAWMAEYIGRLRLDLTTEKATQADLHDALLRIYEPHAVRREARLGARDIPDFLIETRLVIELKGPRHRAPQVWRQLNRYAAYPQVEAIILATSKAMALPRVCGGKPLLVVNLGRAWL